MRISDEEYARITRRLDAADDALLVRNIIETLCSHITRTRTTAMERLHYEIDATTLTDRFTFTITGGIPMFALEYVDVIRNVRHSRVLDVRLEARDLRVVVELARAAFAATLAPEPPYAPPQRGTKRRRTAVDYAAAGVENADDRATIDAIVGAVFDSAARISVSMTFWYETVSSGGGGSGDADDESVSEAGGASGPTIGYSLCFGNPPPLSAAFLEYLHTTYAAAIAGAYVWFAPPARVYGSPLFVVNVRAADSPAAIAKRVMAMHVPRGLPPART
jgi:hypothetical protein